MKGYPAYKDSGIDWLKSSPDQWERVKLKYLGILYGGLSGKSGPDFSKVNEAGFKPFIPFTNIANNHAIDTKDFQFVKIAEGEAQNRVEKNDLLFLMSSENYDDVGKSSVLLEDIGEVYLNSFCRGFRITESGVNPEFLNHLLNAHLYRKKVSIQANGFTRINLKMSGLADLAISLPPFPEQTAIANFLDHKTAQIDLSIQKRQELIELLQEQRAAIINEAVTKGLDPKVPMKDSGIEWIGEVPAHWEVTRMKFIAIVNPKKGDSIVDKEDDSLVAFLPMEKVSENGDVQYSLKKPLNEVYSGFTYFEKGDVILAKITPCFENGKGALLNQMDTMIGFGSTEFHVLRATKKIDRSFLFYVTRTDDFMKLGEIYMTGAAGQKRVPTSFVEDYSLGLPPVEEQVEIVNFIDTHKNQFESEIHTAQQEVNLLKEYRQSLIAEAVTGKIDVRDYPLN